MPVAAADAKSLQSCPTLCEHIDGSPPGFPILGILQAKTLEWIAISFSNAWKWKVKGKSISHVRLFPTPWTAAYQAPASMDFPGKSTGVGAIAFSVLMPRCCYYCYLVTKSCPTLLPVYELQLARLSQSMGFPKQEYWSRLLFLLYRIFLTQGLNWRLLKCRWIL